MKGGEQSTGEGEQRAGLRVLLAGGGTGGHVIPALAIARELEEGHGAEVQFVGTERGLETRLVPEAGFPLELIRVGQLNGVSLGTRAKTLADLPMGVAACVKLLKRFKPNVVVGVGGYASGPAMMGAILLRLPTLAFEPNAVPGMANRLVGRWVKAAAVNFPETQRYFKTARITGIPVRREFFSVEPKESGARRLLVFGGSQGARALNEILPKVAGRLLAKFEDLEIVHQVGERNEGRTRDAYLVAGIGFERIRVQRYLHEMVEEFRAADVVLCRSGASTMAELAAAGKAAVLVPFPRAADDHQRKNAEAFVAAGAAKMLLEAELSQERLVEVLGGLLEDAESRLRMGATARRLAHADAVEAIAEMVVKLSGRTVQ